MAFIPDLAIEDNATLSSPAWRLYCNICRRRNHQTRETLFSFAATKRTLAISRTALYRALQELREKQWIEQPEPHRVKPIYGDFSPVDRRYEQSQLWDKPSQHSDKPSRKSGQHNKEYTSLIKPAIYTNPSHPDEKTQPEALNGESGISDKAIMKQFDCLLCSDSGYWTHANGAKQPCEHPHHWKRASFPTLQTPKSP